MKRILIPTDLSDLGDHAYSIANVLAEKTGAEICLFSVIPGPSNAFYCEDGHLKNDEGNDYSEWEAKKTERQSKLEEWAKDKKDIKSIHTDIGRVNDLIVSYAETNKIDMIVMGTQGLFGMDEVFKNSHTQYIMNHTKVPVISLKCNRADVSLNEIVLVSDFHDIKECPLGSLKAIAAAFDSKIVLLKIKTPHAKRTEEEIIRDMKAFVDINNLSNVDYYIYNDKSVEQGVSKFCMEKHIDLIALGTHQNTEFSKLFRNSVSDNFVNHLFHPILTFPINN